MIKPNFEGSFKSITAASLVCLPRDLAIKVEEMLGHYPEGVLVEEFILGRDITLN
jgi:D-alanine-D-alanine ligase